MFSIRRSHKLPIKTQLSDLAFNSDRHNTFQVQVEESTTERGLNNWVSLEKRDGVIETLIQNDLNDG